MSQQKIDPHEPWLTQHRLDGEESGRQESHYLHGTHPEEQRRLSLLNDLLNERALRELGPLGGERVLDLGSGLGQFSRAMARAVGPEGLVVGIERSAEQIAAALRSAREAGEDKLVEFRQGDALRLPLRADEWGSFDVAHTRYLLEHLPNPLDVVRNMVQAVRPGGRIILADDDHDILRLWPEPAGFGPLWSAYIRSFERLGNDPCVGRRLVSLLHEAGAVPRRTTWVFFGSCSGAPDFACYVENLIGVLETAREAIIQSGFLDRTSFSDAIDALKVWGDRSDAAFWYALSWAEGVRPECKGYGSRREQSDHPTLLR